MNESFQNALPILDEIEKHGYEAYFVGGAVRDVLLQRDIHDVDIATSATPNELKAIFKKTFDVGIEHGTIGVLLNHELYEVTTFRTESEYEDFRRPSAVEFVRSLREDLQRRDFTMNAIAMDRGGALIDPFDGQKDLNRKMIRTVGRASDRFQEDALRMMRAVRFFSQLSFEIEQNTSEAIIDHAALLNKVAVERKQVEFDKLLMGENCLAAINLLSALKLYLVLPGLSLYEAKLKSFHFPYIKRLTLDERWLLLLIHCEVQDEADFLKKWRIANKRIKKIEKGLLWLKHRMNHSWDDVSMYRAGEDIIRLVENVYAVLHHDESFKLDDVMKQLEGLVIKERSELAVNGTDLINWSDVPKGPWVSERLIQIEEAVLKKKVDNDSDAIKGWLSTCNHH